MSHPHAEVELEKGVTPSWQVPSDSELANKHYPNSVLKRQQVINWLRDNNFPALPVALAQDPYKYYQVVEAKPEQRVWQHCPLIKFQPKPL